MAKRWLVVLSALFASVLLVSSNSPVLAQTIAETDFEDGSLASWNIGAQTGSLTSTITQSGTGVSLISGAVTFDAPAHDAVGSPTLPDGSDNPYYQPAVEPASWSFSPYGTYAVALQPKSESTFDIAMGELGLTGSDVTALKGTLSSQASASGYGSGDPTDASWITKSVTLSAGTVYTMSWNYIGTDYVPFNDGSVTSLTTTADTSTSAVTVNNQSAQYALLGFTNPGTGDYSTGTYGSTGWQVSTYEVSVTGEYLLGFAVFNLDDTGLSPVLLVDSEPGGTTKNDEPFGAVAPNNPDAPTVAPTTTTQPPATTTEPPAPAPTPNPAPAPTPVYWAELDPAGGVCDHQGTGHSDKWSFPFLGYHYIPGADECVRDGFTFKYWAHASDPTVSASLPLLVDWNTSFMRYFITSDVNLVAVWEENVPETTVPDTTVPETVPPVDIPVQLPVTGSDTGLNIAVAVMLAGAVLLYIFPRRKGERP